MAIINPNSGPDPSGPDANYKTYMKKLAAAGISQIGYVHTSYGQRPMSQVTADVSTYATLYSGLGLQGIFVDEAANTENELSYYTTLFNYIRKLYQEVFINPGTSTVQGYLSVSTNIMTYEGPGSGVAGTTLPPWVLCANTTQLKSGWQYRFSAIANGASVSDMPNLIQDFHKKGVGYVYATDVANGCCTYNTLASYFAQEAATVLSLN